MGEAHVDLLGPVRILHEHLTEALCEQVFDDLRVHERRRVWTLTKMAEFWTAVVLRAPQSLHQALEEAFSGSGGFPHVQASTQAFFARAQGLRWEFFRDIHRHFTASVLPLCAPIFAQQLRAELSAFSDVLVVDGTTLDRVAHRLKVLWDERSVILPGKLLALYDLFRGVPRVLHFHEDAKSHEIPLLLSQLESLAPGTLLVADRAYRSPALFGELEKHQVHGLIRKKSNQFCERLEVLSDTKRGPERVTDTLALVGTGRHTPKRRLRVILWRRGKKVLELFTDVLDPARLSAQAALDLYARRWKVERLFYDLKVVLNLRRFYAANINAVAMQVYAAAIVYAAMRAAQGNIAQAYEIPPERLSTAKLFPRLAAASYALVQCELGYLATVAANPGVELVEPDWSRMAFARATLNQILSQPRNGKRRRRRRCPGREKSTSLHRFKNRRRRRR